MTDALPGSTGCDKHNREDCVDCYAEACGATAPDESGVPVVPDWKVGMRVIDPAYPDNIWTIIQADSTAIYLQRQDGHLHHHSPKSWRWCWTNGTLKRAPDA